MEPWHFDAMMTSEERDTLKSRAIGRTLISASGTPLGFGGVYFDENGDGMCVAIAFFYGGPNGYFMRKYLPLALRAFRETCQVLVGMGIETVYAVADCRVPEADKFIEWMNGRLVDATDPHGPIYAIDLAKSPLLAR